MRRFIFLLFIIIILVAIDQISKQFLIQYLSSNSGFEIFSFLELVFSWNHGISFGLFSGYRYSNIVFLSINSMIILYLICLLYKDNKIGIAFAIGGAIGNHTDRILYGGVFDFIHFHYQNYSLPAFNIADTAITVGALLIIYDYLSTQKLSKQ